MKNTEENNKLIAEFMGYYQPAEVKDDLFSFEVYSSLDECKKDYPKDEISTYYNDDIENFQLVDEPKYDESWDWLMPVVEKIESLNYTTSIYHLPRTLNTVKIFSAGADVVGVNGETKMQSLYKAVVEFIKWYNDQK